MESKSKDVWVYIEQNAGKIADVSLELLSKGRKLAEQMGGTVHAVLLGHKVKSTAEECFRFGASSVLLVDNPELEFYKTLPYSRIISELVAERQPRIVLFGASINGRDLAPRVASSTVSGLTADCTDLQISDLEFTKKKYEKLLLQIRPAFGGNIIATIITPENPIQMATVREGVMEMSAVDSFEKGTIEDIPYTPTEVDRLISIIERHQEESKGSIKNASIIVSGGYGMGNKGNFKLIHKLAECLGGEVAGSRAAVDAGYVEQERQVGQTGVTVRPKLYIAVGISGSIQHRAGMQESNKIIAINTDPDAPIFKVCHYGIVGDALKTIPMLIQAYKNKLK